MIVDDDPSRTDWIEEQLGQLGLHVCATVTEPLKLLKVISEVCPEIILIDMDSPGRDILDSLAVLSEQQPVPVVMFSAEEDPDYIGRAVQAGVSTYLVGSIDPTKVQPLLEAAMAQFRRFQALHTALVETRSELASRHRIDEAKHVLMDRLKISENEAYGQMRSMAMNEGLPLARVAELVLKKLGKQELNETDGAVE